MNPPAYLSGTTAKRIEWARKESLTRIPTGTRNWFTSTRTTQRFITGASIEARAAGKALISEGTATGPKRKTLVYVNNRLEGNAISTIAAMLEPIEG